MIYVSKDGEWEPPTGSYLGELTGTTFVPAGPKNYAYKTNTSKTVCKVRGITLNYSTVQKVNFNVMCDMNCLRALSDCADILTVHIPFKIARNTNDKKRSN